jgi:excisionase family DNA binding protein
MAEVVSANRGAEVLGLSEKTIRRWIKAGRLKAERHGRDYRIDLGELLAVGGQDGRTIADSGHDGHVASAPPKAGSAPMADSPQTGLAELVALVRDLQGELMRRTEAAATWQTRAEVLALQLEDARAQLALGAPADAPESRPGGPERPESGGVARESTPVPSGPWWRRLWTALSDA